MARDAQMHASRPEYYKKRKIPERTIQRRSIQGQSGFRKPYLNAMKEECILNIWDGFVLHLSILGSDE